MAGGAAALFHQRFAMRDFGGRWGLELNLGQQVGIGLRAEESGEKVELLLVEAVARHQRVRVVIPRAAQPIGKPLRLHFGPDAGEFRPHVAAYHEAGGVDGRVAGRTEGFAIDTRSRLRIRNRRARQGRCR